MNMSKNSMYDCAKLAVLSCQERGLITSAESIKLRVSLLKNVTVFPNEFKAMNQDTLERTHGRVSGEENLGE